MSAPKPVKTDRGEVFCSMTEAARALGTNEPTVRYALLHGTRVSGRVVEAVGPDEAAALNLTSLYARHITETHAVPHKKNRALFEVGARQCSKCGRVLPLDAFRRNVVNCNTNYSGVCRECICAERRRRYAGRGPRVYAPVPEGHPWREDEHARFAR